MTTETVFVVMHQPTDVWADGGSRKVLGSSVTITWPDGRVTKGDIIPPEGDCPSCWLGDLWDADMPEEVAKTLGFIAGTPADTERVECWVEE